MVVTMAVAVAASASCTGSRSGADGSTAPSINGSPPPPIARSPSPPTSSPSSTALAPLQASPGDAGWIVYRDGTDGFELQAPEWMKDVTSSAVAQNPLVRAAIENPLLPTTRVQVLVVPLHPGTSLDAFASSTASRLAQIPGIGDVSAATTAALSGVTAKTLDWSASSNGFTLIEREYLVVRDGRGYVLSMDTTPKPHEADFELFAKLVPRFRFLP